MSEVKFFICEHCKKIITEVTASPVPVMCCGQKMKEIIPNSTDAATEKHYPVLAIDGSTVKVTVSSVEHPMVEAHYIDWICLQTEQGIQIKQLTVNEKPEASFAVAEGDKVLAAYAYSNLHGLWKTEA